MNKQVIFVPQVNTTTESLKLSVAVELLYRRIQTMEVQFMQEPESLSLDDWEDFIECAKFLNEHGGKNFKTIDSVQEYINDECRKINSPYNFHGYGIR